MIARTTNSKAERGDSIDLPHAVFLKQWLGETAAKHEDMLQTLAYALGPNSPASGGEMTNTAGRGHCLDEVVGGHLSAILR
jgi:hypothetical protein